MTPQRGEGKDEGFEGIGNAKMESEKTFLVAWRGETLSYSFAPPSRRREIKGTSQWASDVGGGAGAGAYPSIVTTTIVGDMETLPTLVKFMVTTPPVNGHETANPGSHTQLSTDVLPGSSVYELSGQPLHGWLPKSNL